MVPAGSEDVVVGTPLAVMVYSEEDVSFYQTQEEDRGDRAADTDTATAVSGV